MNTLEQQVRGLLAQGNKIQAVKLVREQTGKGLKESKDYVDSMVKSASPEIPAGISKETLAFEIKEFLAQGNKVMAVKRVHELTGWGLKQSKDFVDAL
ncbi:MAG TPA: 50S ribosomal protein L7/L12 [Chloroflexi bacterium]|nr:MAG: hypothetical protein B6243_10820 [Anaerolineaceae bacterium 4572_5.2]HEY84291.1 50S ribosomal protein L7/L12 [Chloroflexota bacterium]